ncbi:MAG: WD40 repeat domain-containing protein, partial [Terriglobia bacterium]
SPALARFSWPRWSPDGRTFLVTGRDTKGRFGLHLVDVHTGAATLAVLLEPQTYFPLAVWSPDGKAIFYTKIEGKDFEDRRLLMRDLETGRERGLYRGHAGFMAVSPNGQWVVFRAREQAGRVATLLLLPTTGGQPRELVRVVAPDDIPLDTLAWTPNGNYVLFGKADRDESQGVSLWRVPAQGGKPQPLGLSMEGLTNLRLHPDGRRVAFTAGRNKNEVWVLENFLPALKAGK